MALVLTYAQMQADIALFAMAQLLNTDLGALLNNCQQSEVDSYEWSFLLTNTVLQTFAPYSVGTATFTQGSTAVVGQGTAWTSAYNGFLIRPGLTNMPFTVASVNSATSITLTTPWMETTQTAAGYNMFQTVYPIAGAKEVFTVRQIFELQKTSREVLNASDPQRIALGGNPCTSWSIAPYAANGSFQIEMWPVPSAVVAYVVEYRQSAVPMVNSTDLPMVSSAVLEAKAMMYVCQSLFASNGQAAWMTLAQKWEKDYLRERDDARHADKQRWLTSQRRPTPTWGLDVLAAHDMGNY